MTHDMGDQRSAVPESWRRYVPDLIGELGLNVAGHEVTIEITREQLTGAYFPVLASFAATVGGDTRIVAGLSGIPGSGKSTYAAALTQVADRVLSKGALVVVGMDGWHWPNAVLDERTTLDETGLVIPLRRRKGGPESFDIAGIASAVRSLGESDRDILLPVYDRHKHDPVPDALVVSSEARIVLMEGNYLLSGAPPWDTVSAMLHPKLFLECDRAVARRRVIARHIRGGSTRKEAEEKYETNDRLNVETVLADAGNADLHIRLTSAHERGT